jgi:POT family proton-dependent oligopeptide transporter
MVQVNFIQQPLPPGSPTGAGFHDGQSGALGLGQRASTGLTIFYQFWFVISSNVHLQSSYLHTHRCYVIPLFGAYIADTHWGRFKTISVSIGIALLGHIIMIISSVPGVIEKKGAVAVFAISLLVTGLGTGGFKANISPLVAEQYKLTNLFV